MQPPDKTSHSMLFALNKRLFRIPIARSGHAFCFLFRRRLSTFCNSAQSVASFQELEERDDMATPDAKAARAPAVTLKTPKGTRDWSGQDMLLREEVLYV